MKGKMKDAVIMALLAVLFFGIITNIVWPYTMIMMKIIFFICGAMCAWGSVFYFSNYLRVYNRKENETVYNLIFRSGLRSSIVNMLTLYRIIICPVLLILLFNDSPQFKWVLLSAFITDALDGFLARHFKVVTKLGARLDSLADDILFAVSLIAVLFLHTEVITQHILIISAMIFLHIIKMIFLWFKHDTIISGLHTYLAKASAFLQALFFIHCMFFRPNNILFNLTCIITLVAITEEIIIIVSFKELKQNVKGLFFTKSQI